MLFRTVVGLAVIAGALQSPLYAQEPVRPDTSGRDTTKVRRLPEIKVTVTRTEEPLQKVPYAVGVLESHRDPTGAADHRAG